jgi:transposase
VPSFQDRTDRGGTLNIVLDHALVAGVDTHRDSHAAALCDPVGRVLAQTSAPATPAGYAALLAWAAGAAAGRPVTWAVESTRHYGLGLARYLAAHGQQVTEIDRTGRAGHRRDGKSDPGDAIRAARELLARPHPARPRADGDREALRLLMIDRDHAAGAAKTARQVLAAVLITAPDQVRSHLAGLPARRRPAACAALTAPPGADRLTAITYQTLASLGHRITTLTQAAATLQHQITAIVSDLAPGLITTEPGIGPITAAQLLLAWSHPGRIRTEAAFAKLAGTAPLPAGSGTTTGRHRLSRLGDRQLNRALHTIAVNRMRHHPPTRAYTARRQAEGKTTPEIRRCIKRYLARHLYRTLEHTQPATT